MLVKPNKITTYFVLFFFLWTQSVYALPLEYEVVEGTATFEQDGNTLNITASDNSIINYESFNIAENEVVNFFLPDLDAFSLNRVVGDGTSNILGTLTANGNLVLINSDGFYFGSASSVDVGGLIASTHDIANANFLANSLIFEGAPDVTDPTTTSILNEGSILTSEGGLAILIADAIENRGTIEAPLGTVALAAGDLVTVGMDPGGVISIAVDRQTAHTILDKDGNTITDQIKNSGTLAADSGKVHLNAQALDQVFESAINLEGVVRSNTVEVGEDGTIEFFASGDIDSTGTLEAVDGRITLAAEGDIVSTGELYAGFLDEQGAAFKVGGEYHVGSSVISNADNAITLATGNYSGETADVADIIVDDNATITLTGDTTFRADSDTDGTGQFTMNSGSSIVGGGNDLTLYSSQSGDLRSITGVGTLTINEGQAASNPTYTANNAISVTALTQNSATLDLNGQALTVDGGDLTIVGGTFTGGTGSIDIDHGNFSMSGGAFTTPTGGFTVERNFTVSGGTYNSSSAVTLDGNSSNDDSTITYAGTLAGTFDFNKTGTGASATVAAGTTISLGADPNIQINGGLTNNGTITVSSGTWMADGSGGASEIINNGTITHSGNGWDLDDLSLTNNGGATITYSGTAMSIEQDFTQSGTFNLTGKTITFDGGNSSDDSVITSSGALGGVVAFNKTGGSAEVTIAAGTSVSLGADPSDTISGGLTNNGTMIVDSGTWTLNSSGTATFTNNGTITHNGNGWDINNISLNNTATNTITYAGTALSIEGDLTQNGTFNLAGKTITFDGSNASDDSTITASGALGGTVVFNKTSGGADVTIASGTNVSFGADPNSTLNGGITNNGTITIDSGTWTVSGGSGAEITNNGTITHSGNGWDMNNMSLNNTGTGSITYAGTALSTDRNFTHDGTFDLTGKTITFDGNVNADDSVISGTQNIQGNVVINKTAVTSDVILGSDVTVEGNFTRTDGVITNPGAAYTLSVQGDFTQNSTDAFGGANLTVEMSGGNAQNITQNAGTIAGAFEVDKSGNEAVLQTALSVGSLTVTNGTLDLSGQNLTLASAQAVNNSGTIQLEGHETLTNVNNLDVDSGTVEYTGRNLSETLTIKDFGTGEDYFNLTINDTNANEATYDTSADLHIDGAFNLTDGTFTAPTNLNVAGNMTIGANGTFTHNSGTVIFDGNTQLTSSGEIFNHIQLGSATAGGILDTLDTFDVNGNISVLNGGATTLNFAGDSVFLAGNMDLTNLDTSVFGASTINFDGSSQVTSNGHTFNNINIGTASAGGIFDSLDDIDIDGSIAVFNGGATTFNVAGDTINIAGDMILTNLDTYIGGSGANFVFDGSGTNSLDTAGTTIDGVTVDGTSKTLQLTGGLTTSALTIGADDVFYLNGNAFTFSSAAAVTNNGTFRLQGGETLTSVNHLDIDSGTVEYVGDNNDGTVETVKDFGGTDYYNLTFNSTHANDTLRVGSNALNVDNNLTLTNGTFDNATNDQAITIGNNFTSNTNDRIDMGDANWTLGGSWAAGNPGTFNADASTLIMNGTGVTLNHINDSSRRLNNVTINGTTSLAGGTSRMDGVLQVNSTLTIGSGQLLRVESDAGDVQITGTGSITGAGELRISNTAGLSQLDGSIDVADLYFIDNHNLAADRIAAGQYDSANVYIQTGSAANRSFTFGSGNYIFGGNVTFETTNTGNLTINNSTSDPNLEFRGNVSIAEAGGGVVNWTKGTGTITLGNNGSDGTQTINFLDKSIEDLVINGTGDVKQLTDGLTVDSLTVTNGILDMNGQAFDFASATSATNNSTIQLSGFETFGANVQNLDITSGTVVITGNGDAKDSDVFNIQDFGATDYYNLTINSRDDNDTFRVSANALNVANDLTLTNGTFDNATNDQAITVGNNVAMDNDQTDMGDATWTVGGSWDSFDVSDSGTFNRDASTINLTGTGTFHHDNNYGNRINNLTIANGANITTAGFNASVQGNVNIAGTFNANHTFITQTTTSVAATGVLTGSSSYTSRQGFNQQDGTVNVASLILGNSGSYNVAAGTYDSASVEFNSHSVAGATATILGDVIFNGNVTFDSDGTGLIIANSTNDPNITFAGNVTLDETDATLTWTKGTGTITLGNNASDGTQTINFLGKSIEDLVIDASGDTKQLASILNTESLTITDGILDTNDSSDYAVNVTGAITQTGGEFQAYDSTVTTSGNVTLDGTSDSSQLNRASLVMNGTTQLTYNNLTSVWTNGFGSLTTGQAGATTTIVGSMATKNSLTIGSGELTGGTLYSNGTGYTFNFDADANMSLSELRFHNPNAVNIVSLANGYDTSILVTGDNTAVTQTGNIVINGTNELRIDGNGSTSRTGTWNTAGYDLTVGGDITLGASGNDTGVKTLNASAGVGGTTTINVGGDFDVRGISDTAPPVFTAGNSTVNFTATSGTQVINSGGSSFYNLTYSGAGSTLQVGADDLSVTNNLTLSSGAGIFDNSTNDRAITVGNNFTADNDQVDMGDATWTVSGNWDNRDVTTWNEDNSTLVMDGANKTIIANTANRLRNLTVDGSVEILNDTTTELYVENHLQVNGTITATDRLRVGVSAGVSGTGRVTGTDTFSMNVANFTQMDGTIDVDTLLFQGGTMVAGQYDSANVIFGNVTGDREITFGAGNTIFTGDVSFLKNHVGDTTTIRNDVNNPNLEFRGNVDITETAGNVVWTKGTGTITLGNNASDGTQTIDFDGRAIEDVVMNATDDTKQLTAGLNTESLNLMAGTFDANDQTLTISGDWTADNTSVSMGDGTWNVGGNVDYQDVTTFNSEGSTLNLTGTGMSIVGQNSSAGSLNDVNVSGSYTLNSNLRQEGDLVVSGTLSLANGRIWRNYFNSTSVTGTGTLTGNGIYRLYGTGATFAQQDGLVDVATLEFVDNISGMVAGTYSSANVLFNHGSGGANKTITIGTGDHIFTGDVEFRNDTALDYNIDNAANNPNFEFRGDVTFTNSGGGTLTWTKGNGTITLGNNPSNGTQTINFLDKTIEDVVVNAAGDTKSFTSGFTADSFTLNAGQVNLGNSSDNTIVGALQIDTGTTMDARNVSTLNYGSLIENGTLLLAGGGGNNNGGGGGVPFLLRRFQMNFDLSSINRALNTFQPYSVEGFGLDGFSFESPYFSEFAANGLGLASNVFGGLNLPQLNTEE